MAVKVLMPKGSDTMTEGKVLKWLKKEGEPVATGDTLLEIETDKVDMEVEAMGSGVLRKVLVDAGKSVPVGDVLAVIGKPDEDISALTKPKVSAPPAAPAAVTSTSTPPATGRTLPSPAAPAEGGRVMASPLARRMALEMGLDINRVTGSGPGGRIIRQDIERMAALTAGARHLAAGLGAETPAPIQAPGVSPIPAPVPSLPRPTMPAPGGPEFYDEPLSSMRKTIAARLVQSLGPVPHFYLTVDVDMQRAKELRESANLLDPTLKLSYNDIILKACAAALRQHPEVNSSFQGESIRYHNRVHVGMAVAVDGGGLITPVIRNCDGKTLSEIARETKDLAARARTRKL
ncbi:MAG: 2-oxo acid dehydrogenase subunit E2, partial [Acidobacteriia bacterium]|nr:2-oxo acid dehydrogenase subunit E2 [Terriglobia bacterium]